MFVRKIVLLIALLLSFPVLTEAQSPESDAEKKHIKALRDQGKQLRRDADKTFTSDKYACYKKIFINNCVNNAKEKRLKTILRARRIENEAHTLDLAERRRSAVTARQNIEDHGPRSTTAPTPSPDVGIGMRLDETGYMLPVKGERAEDAARRAKAQKAAARRAEKAREERARYDQRIRELEEKKARDTRGR